MDKNIILANVIAFVASLIPIFIGLLKDKKKILFGDVSQKVLSCISNIILGGYTGSVNNVAGIIRNYLCYKDKLSIKSKILLTIFQVIICLMVGNLTIVNLFPLIATIFYTFFIVYDAKRLKVLSIITTILWSIYNLHILSYTAFFFNIFSIISNVVGLCRLSLSKNDTT